MNASSDKDVHRGVMTSVRCRLCAARYEVGTSAVMKRLPARAQHLPRSQEVALSDVVEASLSACPFCGQIQLHGGEVPYFREVIRAANVSQEMLNWKRKQFAAFVERHKLQHANVLEIGCGRGEYLEQLLLVAKNAVGIEASLQNLISCRNAGLPVQFGYPDEGWWPEDAGRFSAFICLNFLEHALNPTDFMREIALHTAEDSVGLLEVPNGDWILRNAVSSEIMTDHLTYFTAEQIELLCRMTGFEVLDITESFGGVILTCEVQKRKASPVDSLFAAHESVRQELVTFLREFPANTTVVWGASHQALAALAALPEDLMPRYIVDSASFKQNCFAPASGIPIHPPEVLRSDSVVLAVLVMAGGYSTEVVTQLNSFISPSVERALFADNRVLRL